MKKNYLEKKLREDIFKEVEKYIGYVYAEDYNNKDKLVVNEFDYSVSHGRCCYEDLEKGYDYFDMFHLIKYNGTFTFAPDPVGIECVVMHYFPNEKVDKFVADVKAAIHSFIEKHEYSEDAEITFTEDTFEVLVDCPSEREMATEMDFEEESNSVSVECRPLRPYIRNTKEKGFVVNEENVRRLGAEMFLEYGLK